MNAWWKIGLISAYTLFVFATAWRFHTILDESRQASELADEIARHQKDQQAANDHAADLEKALAAERLKSASINQQWSNARVQTPDCPLRPDAVRVLRVATSPTGHNPR